MRAPRVDSLDDVDIALIGVPFQLGTSIRIGSYAGPAAVREASRIVRGHNTSTGISPFARANVADVGDAPHNPLDFEGSLGLIKDRFTELHARGVRWVACGGDHTIALPILRALSNGEALAVVQFDAHTDTWEELYGVSLNSGTVIRRAAEEGLIDPYRTVQIGIRGTRFEAGDVEKAEALGIRCITYDRYEELGREAVIAEVREIIGDHPTYVTFDMDALDPVFAPGTAGPEPGGLSMRDAQVILRALTGSNVVSADVSEIAPALDPVGLTAMNAAQIMFELLCLVAARIDRRDTDGESAAGV
ncbi:MAG TPA: agmatinase [Gammaproteobacteria bacterium]|nr:agmatinase [Gammaproteobacteria bacterium]